MGQMEIAHEMINTAAIFCKADAIKFQKKMSQRTVNSRAI